MTNTSDSSVTREGQLLIERWDIAQAALIAAQREVNRITTEALNSTNELGKWLCPSDARDGETFCVWDRKRLLVVTFDASRQDYSVRVRK